MLPSITYVIYGYYSGRTTPGVSQYRSLTLEEKYCCGNYSRQGQRWRFESGKVKHELRITSSNPRVTSSNPQVTSSNPRVASSNLQVTS